MPDYVDDTANLKELSVKRNYTGADTPSGGHETPVDFVLKSEVKLGAWSHAMACELNLGTSGSSHGNASAGTSILIPPNGSLQRGALYSHVFEIGCQASSTWPSAGPVAFLKFDQWGTPGHFDANAFFIDIQGLGEGTANVFSAGSTDKTVTGTLRIRIGGSTYYIMLTNTATS